MLPGLQPCFQLLRVGASDPGRDLFTFRPALPRCVFRVGRRPELCDVLVSCAARPELVSRLHAELHAEREEEEGQERGWRVFIVDQSSYGTWLNDSLLLRGQRTELRDGDTLTFGAPARSPECYFLFQRAVLRPDAIALPRAPAPPARTSPPPAPRRASLVLSSIGSISRLGARPLTFHPAPPAAAAPRQRRKSAHTLLAEPGDELPAARRLCRSESEAQRRRTPPGRRRRTLSSPQESSGGRRRGRPRKRPPLAAPGAEPCAARRCLLPQEDTVQWVQCDDCDAWYHVDCAGCSYSCLLDDAAEFHCGCR